ncbi:hypothetical protein C8255_16680 [filamentous cyanobacterium CCP3]|nr:hypothetical protein C8255_16680 [filamentous cyanobacterium CCP3]
MLILALKLSQRYDWTVPVWILGLVALSLAIGLQGALGGFKAEMTSDSTPPHLQNRETLTHREGQPTKKEGARLLPEFTPNVQALGDKSSRV